MTISECCSYDTKHLKSILAIFYYAHECISWEYTCIRKYYSNILTTLPDMLKILIIKSFIFDSKAGLHSWYKYIFNSAFKLLCLK